MDLTFFKVFTTVLSLMLLIVPGFILVKTKLFSVSAGEVLSTLVLYVCQPSLMLISFQKTAFSPEIAVNMLIVLGLAILIHLIMIGVVFLIIRKKHDSPSFRSLRFASIFSNCGYMGLPFLQALFSGGEILIYAGVIIAVFNVFTWSVGTWMVSGDKKQMSIKKAILNPTVICIFIGLLMFFILQKPVVDLAVQGSDLDLFLTKIIQVVEFLAEAVTPLSMTVIGIRLANVSFKKLLLNKQAYLNSAIKLILMPLLIMCLVSFLPISVTIKYALLFLLSMPSAANTVLFSVKFGGDGDSASVYVLLSIIFSILTIPLMFIVFQNVFGVVF